MLFPKSPRHVSTERAKALAAQARGRAAIVVLTVDAEDALLDEMVAAADPAMLQLHGRETPERVAAVRARFGRPVMKAVGVSGPEDVAAAPWPTRSWRTRSCSTPSRRPARACPAATAWPSTGASCRRLTCRSRSCFREALTPDNVGEAVAVSRRARRRCLVRRRDRARRQGPRPDPRLRARRAKRGSARRVVTGRACPRR